MKNIDKLFSKKPALGWGMATHFTGLERCMKEALEIVEGHGSVQLVLHRANYLEECKQEGREAQTFQDWVLKYREQENTYAAYMLRNFSFENGSFVLPEDVDIDALAGKILEFAGIK